MKEQNNDGNYDYDCPPNPKIVLPIIAIILALVIVLVLLN
jgi:hypothetical protein